MLCQVCAVSNLLASESLSPGKLEHPQAGGRGFEEEEEEGSVGAVEEGSLAHLVGEHMQGILGPGMKLESLTIVTGFHSD